MATIQAAVKSDTKTEDFKIFHATKFKASKGVFEGWLREKSMRVVNNLAAIIQKNLTEGVLINLPYEKYIDEYRNTPTPKSLDLDSQYGLCFRALMAHIVGVILEIRGKHKLHVVVERGHRNAKNTEKIFNEMKLTLKARGIELLGEWSLAAKEERDELMVADYLVHSYAMMIRPGGREVRGYADQAPEPKKSDAGLTFLEFQSESLKNIKLEMQRQRWERQAYNRRLKAETKAASSSSLEIEATAADSAEQPC